MKSVSLLSHLFLVVATKISSVLFSDEKHSRANKKTIRVLIRENQPSPQVKKQYGVRWNFDKSFSTTVSEKQYQLLKKKQNINVELIPKVKLEPGLSSDTSHHSMPKDRIPRGVKTLYQEAGMNGTSGRGSGVRVAILDTGVYINHVDLAENVEQCKDFSSAEHSLRNQCHDEHGHGTHAAGTVLANGGSDGLGIFGIAPGAKLWAYKVLGKNGSGYSDDVAYAIRHAADQAEKAGTKVVISMCFEERDALISQAITYANHKGALIIRGANEGSNRAKISPGEISYLSGPNTVTSLRSNNKHPLIKQTGAGYEIIDGEIHVKAPGIGIESTWKDGGYRTLSGNSTAPPHIAGLAAGIWSQDLQMSNHSLRLKLKAFAEAQNKERSPCNDEQLDGRFALVK
ncbi:S8 family serine peptidase [Halobacillus salinarum]|uniref:S8 family serine peptidase n=1 Tax=Halobacillus salinarum TaxID=2932257 RepID=A0ABY4EKT8_9BACI|nr:S8 family serine peptidase [Halobacillus salinarum]UOQ45083.1 S8 family serine peptidase [Halobacillus salinarum]